MCVGASALIRAWSDAACRSLVPRRPDAVAGFRSRTIEATVTVAIRNGVRPRCPTRLVFGALLMTGGPATRLLGFTGYHRPGQVLGEPLAEVAYGFEE